MDDYGFTLTRDDDLRNLPGMGWMRYGGTHINPSDQSQAPVAQIAFTADASDLFDMAGADDGDWVGYRFKEGKLSELWLRKQGRGDWVPIELAH